MIDTKSKEVKKARKKARNRSKIFGTAARPRIALSVSNRHLIAQFVDDENGKTLAYKSTVAGKYSGSKKDIAKKLASDIAKDAVSNGIQSAVFDRGHKKYHGVVKEFVESIRDNGIKI